MLTRGREETPLDDRGLVDHRALIELALDRADAKDLQTREDTHHTYWYVDLQTKRHDDEELIDDYRELPINKILMPRGLHEIIHSVTKPPPLPPPDVMAYRKEAWRVASTLFQKTHETQMVNALNKSWGSRKRHGALGPVLDTKTGDDWAKARRRANIKGEESLRVRNERIPAEYRLDEDFDRGMFAMIYHIRRLGSSSESHKTGRLSLPLIGVNLEQVPALAHAS